MQRFTIRNVLALSLILVVAFCFSGVALAQDSGGDMQKMEDHDMMMKDMGGMHDMSFIFTADTLYHCPNHTWFVTTDGSAHCAVKKCETKLTMMTPGEVKMLRDSHPKGCAHCMVAVPGDDKMMDCPVCGAALKEIPMPGMMKDDGMMKKDDGMMKKDDGMKKEESKGGM